MDGQGPRLLICPTICPYSEADNKNEITTVAMKLSDSQKQVTSSVLVPVIIPCIKGHILRGSQDAVRLQKAYLYL